MIDVAERVRELLHDYAHARDVMDRNGPSAPDRSGVEGLGVAAIPALVHWMRQPNADAYVRQEAALAVGRIGSPEAVEALMACLNDGIAAVGWAASSSLRVAAASCDEAVRARVVDTLVAALAAPATRTWSAADALGAVDPERALGVFPTLVRDKDFSVRSTIATFCRARPGRDPRVRVLLAVLARDKNPWVSATLLPCKPSSRSGHWS